VALVVLLRGVNVGGHRTFRPSMVAKALGAFDVVNVGAAGTFVIRKTIGRKQLQAELASRLPFDTEVMICDGQELLHLAAAEPFAGEGTGPDVVRFVSVLARRASPPSLPLSLPADGKWLLKIVSCHNRFVCGVYRREMKAIGYLGQLDKVFGVPVTTRNWNTIQAIARILAAGTVRR
jgi:uncharacterized protein (DUF1697 family)